MRSILCALLATVGAFSLTSIAEAGGCHGGFGYGYGGYHAPSYYNYGGFGYGHGFDRYSQLGCLPYSYRSWSRRCWFPRYNCYGYFCPTRSCWYYYYQPFNRYMPVQYMNQYQPFNNNANININTNVNSNANALPPGATTLPIPH